MNLFGTSQPENKSSTNKFFKAEVSPIWKFDSVVKNKLLTLRLISLFWLYHTVDIHLIDVPRSVFKLFQLKFYLHLHKKYFLLLLLTGEHKKKGKKTNKQQKKTKKTLFSIIKLLLYFKHYYFFHRNFFILRTA